MTVSTSSPSAFFTSRPRPLLCAVTDARRFASHDDVVAYAAALADAGIDLLQVREPDLDAVTLLRLVERVCDAARGSATRVVVNDRVDVAMAAGAAGVHLRGSSYAASRARALLGDAAIVGRSVHDAREAADVAAAGGLDYVIFGTVFPTSSKPEGHPVGGVEALASAVRACRLPASVSASVPVPVQVPVSMQVQVPVLAIGGVTEARVPDIARTGAAGIAAIGLFADAFSAAVAPQKRAFALRSLAQRLRLAYNL